MQQDEAELARLQAERARQSGDLAGKREALARLLRAAQQGGEAPPLKALLAQDRVADAERALTYQGYLQRAQVARIRQLTDEIARLQALEDAILQRRNALDAAGRAQAAQLPNYSVRARLAPACWVKSTSNTATARRARRRWARMRRRCRTCWRSCAPPPPRRPGRRRRHGRRPSARPRPAVGRRPSGRSWRARLHCGWVD